MDTISLSSAIDDYISSRRTSRLETRAKEAEKERKTLANDQLALMAWEQKQADLLRSEVERYLPANWLDDAAKRAKQITLVTHAPKYTNGDAKGSGVLADVTLATGEYLCTASLSALNIDVVGNAAALDVANLLLLEVNGEQLVDVLRRGDASPLSPFARDEMQLTDWLAGFRQALESGVLSSHKLAKQIYFPVGEDSYHLISPLFASSLAQAQHERIEGQRFGEEAKTARVARKNREPHETDVIDFPNLAVQTFGGTKPQNVSLLNSGRHGKAYLLNSQPPRWKSQDKPPADDQAFWRQYGRLVYPKIRELKSYLLFVVDKESTLSIRDRRAELVADLVSELHQLAARIQSQVAGWSLNTSLSITLAHWLDPARDDKEFVEVRLRNDWQQGVGEQFATWLNRQLQNEQLQMKDAEHSIWRKLVERELKLLKGDLEVLA